MVDWSGNTLLDFISLYRDHPVLWDPTNTSYKNYMKKFKAWEEISRDLRPKEPRIPVEELKKKMGSLLATFRKLRRQELASPNTSSDITWFAYKSFAFMNPIYSPKYFTPNESYQDQETSNDYTRDDSDSKLSLEELAARHAFSSSADLNELVQTTDSNGQIIIEGQNNGFVKQEVDDEERNPSTSTSKRRRVDNTDDMNQDNEDDSTNVNKRRRYTERRYIPANNRQTQQSNEWLQPSDDCLSFGRYIADKLRNYKYNTRCSVQHAISEVIFSADQGRFDTYFEDYVNDDNRKTEKSCDSQDHEGDENFLNDA